MFKPDREQALAKTALALMGECGVAPTPTISNCSTLHASGENPGRQPGDRPMMRGQKKPFTARTAARSALALPVGARAARDGYRWATA